MHELGIAQEILNIAEQYVPADSNPVKYVKVKIGRLSNVLIDSLKFGYEALSDGTPFQNSELLIEEVPVTLECLSCGKNSKIDGAEYLCPECSSIETKVITGTELQVVEIEVED